MVRGMDRLLFCDDQPGTAPRALLVVRDQVWAGPVCLRQVGQMRREDDAVGDRDRAQAQRREEVGKLWVPHSQPLSTGSDPASRATARDALAPPRRALSVAAAVA